MKFSQVTWCARRKRSGWVVFGGFGGWFLGAGCIRFAGLGQKFDIFSHQQALFVGRKLKDGSFNTSTKMVVFKNSGHSPRVCYGDKWEEVTYAIFFSFVLLERILEKVTSTPVENYMYPAPVVENAKPVDGGDPAPTSLRKLKPCKSSSIPCLVNLDNSRLVSINNNNQLKT